MTEIRSSNPWRTSIGSIAWGLILTMLRLNFLNLQYILPTIGVILLFIGFCQLRKENKFFRGVWILSIVTLLLQLGDLARVSTPLYTRENPALLISVILLAIQVSMLLLFHAALQEVYQKVEQTAEGAPLRWAAFWVVGAFLIALTPLSTSWLAFLPMILIYLLIAKSLFRIGMALDDVGYVPANAPTRVSNMAFGWSYFLIALSMVVTCSVYFNHLKLEPQEYQPPTLTNTRGHLLSMGFPEEALQYLSEEDVLVLGDAINVKATSELLMLDPKEVQREENDGYSTYVTIDQEPGQKNIEATTVYIQMPDQVVYVLQYFAWKGGQPVWQDGIQIAGESQSKDWQIVSSSLFFRKNSIHYTAAFPRLVCGNMTQNQMYGPANFTQIAGALSYPFGSECQGGYVLYRYQLLYESDLYVTHSILNYVHLSSPLHLPYANTEDRILNGADQDAMKQHYTTYESMAYQTDL